jgi:uroporphyrinogen-III synthase
VSLPLWDIRISAPDGERTDDRITAIWQERASRPGRGAPQATLGGRRVLTLESRRAPELALLVMNYGGTPVVAPAVREVPLESNDHVIAFAEDVIRERFDLVVMLTGVGGRMMIKIVDPVIGRAPFVDALARTRIAARGPKPVAALRELGLAPWVTAPSPNTWRELVAALDAPTDEAPLRHARVAVQEYGSPHPDLEQALTARAAELVTVPIYRWSMPDDLEPLRRAVWAIIRNEIDIVVFTASIQLVHLLRVADDMGLTAAVRKGLERSLLVSIGPMTSEELQRQGLPIDLEPSHPKMGFLVKELAEQCEMRIRVKQCAISGKQEPSL